MAVLNPADESVLGTVPHATRADLDAALGAAREGLRIWRQSSPAKRADIILKAAQLARERVEEMAVAMTLEQGKPIAQWRLEILRGCDIVEWTQPRGDASKAASFREPVPAHRRRRGIFAVEFPDEFARPQGGGRRYRQAA